MDYHLGVWVLCSQANRARWERARKENDVSAETSERTAQFNRNVPAETSDT
jgi:hypothetical protein